MNHLTEIIVLAVIVLAVVIMFLKQDAYKTTRQQLQRLPKDFKIKNHILAKNDKGEKIIIEHLIMSQAGIFLINICDHNGKVIGEEPQQKWKVVTKTGQKEIHNPTIDNLYAVKSMRSRINDPEGIVPIYPVVVFGKKADLSEVVTESTVIRATSLVNYLKKFKEAKLSDLELEAVFNKI
ncbi:NERD domain-containing protein [Clostridium sp. 'deep sea']|uniref:nuclease-related domain-containing protein n=1 Tax=Clostridium sp. 'deep sea' TaxID=2779445 RepID=UPI0018966C89|nr:nuclease-related domain-containing protein [Clostridium sp. 'deep sea']QOR34129.1 NERD domain-containing protein [Clostridium sp. 'deep sea']